MSKKKKNLDSEPFYLDMNIDLEGLQGAVGKGKDGKEMTPAKGFMNLVEQSFFLVCQERKKGLEMREQRRLWALRDTLNQAIEADSTENVKVEAEDFRFLMKYWNQQVPMPQYNEMIKRVTLKLDAAQSEHDKRVGRAGDSDSEEE